MPRSGDPEDNDAALRWDDGDDASYDLGPAPGDEREPKTFAASEPDEARATPVDRKRSVSLVATGVFGGVYLMYTAGWLIGGLRVSQSIFESLTLAGAGILELNAYRFAEFLALIAAPLWFVAVIVLTSATTVLQRFGWLALGLLILAPWPFLVGLMASGGA
jgi:hypothetical protein